MKKISFQLASLSFLFLFSCQNEMEEKNVETNQQINKESNLEKFAPCSTLYALVLPGNGTGSPMLPNINSYIYKVNLGSIPIGYTFTSQIKIGGTPVTCVTGLCDMTGTADYAWAVTGQNSNFPKKILKVHISSGQATLGSTTTDYLQDIENLDASGTLVGIKEGTSQLLKLNASSGICSLFAPNGPTSQYNGLTVKDGKLYAISGLTNYICSPKTGDIFEYLLTGGHYVAKHSYKSSVANYTMKELGFYYDNCYGKKWLVGSAQAVISNNTSINPCYFPYPNFLLYTPDTRENYHGIYDFMSKP